MNQQYEELLNYEQKFPEFDTTITHRVVNQRFDATTATTITITTDLAPKFEFILRECHGVEEYEIRGIRIPKGMPAILRKNTVNKYLTKLVGRHVTIDAIIQDEETLLEKSEMTTEQDPMGPASRYE